MMHIAPVYGFEFTRPFSAAGLSFTTSENNSYSAKRIARDLSAHHMTGTIAANAIDRETIYELEGVLSFIEHLDVMVLEPISAHQAEPDPTKAFEPTLIARRRHNGGGAVIGSDAFNPCKNSRQQFIELCLTHLKDKSFCDQTRFRSLLFKSVETFRQRQPFLEITYFLLISGLEAFCRACQGDYTSRNAAIPITNQLKLYGFNVFQDNSGELSRSISTYLHIRNALFHQGDFTSTVNINHGLVQFNCSQHLFNLSMLCSLTVMKAIGFDDGHTNWDCWIDRELHR